MSKTISTSTVKISANERNVPSLGREAEDRRRMISEAAYYLAEKRNFQGGDPMDDWLRAESEIDKAMMVE